MIPKQKKSGGLITDLSPIIDPLYCFGAYAIISVRPTKKIQHLIRKGLWFEYNLLCDVQFIKYDGNPLVYSKKKDQANIDASKVTNLYKLYLYNLVYDPIKIHRGDQSYIGEIPVDVSVEDLSMILANGLKKYMYIYAFLDQRKLQSFTIDELVGVLDGWFERDGRNEDCFDHIIDNDELENGFLENVANKAINLIS